MHTDNHIIYVIYGIKDTERKQICKMIEMNTVMWNEINAKVKIVVIQYFFFNMFENSFAQLWRCHMEQANDPTWSCTAKNGLNPKSSLHRYLYYLSALWYQWYKNKTNIQNNGYKNTYVKWNQCKSETFDAKEECMYVASSVLNGLSDRKKKNRLHH